MRKETEELMCAALNAVVNGGANLTEKTRSMCSEAMNAYNADAAKTAKRRAKRNENTCAKCVRKQECWRPGAKVPDDPRATCCRFKPTSAE